MMIHISHHDNSPFIIYTQIALIMQLTSLKKCYNILFCWVPGHLGILGNEKTDEASKRALTPLQIKIPFPDIKLLIKKLFMINGKKFGI